MGVGAGLPSLGCPERAPFLILLLMIFVKGVQPERSQHRLGSMWPGEQLGTGVDNLIPMRTGAVCGTAKGRRVDSAEALFFS